jgi:glycosyltransferase involved in cell wall biosynthesis
VKILIVNNLYAPNVRGGAERSVQLLAEALVRDGKEVTVVTTAEHPAEMIEVGGVRVVTLSIANLYWPFGDAQPSPLRRKLWHLIDIYNPLVIGRLTEVMRSERPDVVHTNNLQGISVAAWRAAESLGVPVLHTLRDYYLACARAICFRGGRNCSQTCLPCLPFFMVRRALSRRVTGVVGTSGFILQRHLAAGFFPAAIVRRTIANPSPSVDRAERGRSSLTTFGYLGRIESAKGVALILCAFAERTGTDWQLLIAGNGSQALVEDLQRQAARAERIEQIRFLGWIDATDFLGRVDVLLVPSLWHEPLPRAIIEAQSNGVAVVGSRRGGISEIVEDGVDGLLFEPDEPGGLSRAIDRLLHDSGLVSRLVAGARERSRRYRPEIIAKQYCEAYEEVKGSKVQFR